MVVLGKGMLKVRSHIRRCKKNITLNDVKYVPTITIDLLSVLAAMLERWKNSIFVSTTKTCWLNLYIIKMLHREIKYGDLFKLNLIDLLLNISVQINELSKN